MTEADRELLMAKYAEVSAHLLELQEQELVDGDVAALQVEKEHLLRCSFFADMLEDME